MQRVSYLDSFPHYWAGLAAVMLMVIAAGCDSAGTPSTETSTGPTFASTVAELDGLFVTIRDGMKDGDHDAAHMALHEVGDPIQRLTALESDSKLSVEERQTVREAAEKMASLYGKLDEAAHDGEEMDYDAVADELAASMKTIKGFVKE